jgi:hypothetical protein
MSATCASRAAPCISTSARRRSSSRTTAPGRPTPPRSGRDPAGGAAPAAGPYAAQAFLDENNNKEVDRALFGIPKEGVGFSNDAKIGFGPPKFADAVFTFNGPSQAIRFNLRYFLGAKGPPARR